MPDLDVSSEQGQSASQPDESGSAGQSSGMLPNRNSVLFWFAASGAVWIALAVSAIWLV